MGTVKVNTDLFVYKVPNEEAGQPPLAKAAYRGDIIDIDDAQEKRGRALLVNHDYPFGTTTVRAVEPALVDVDHDSELSAAEAARQARIRQLNEQLAALGAGDIPDDVPTLATDDGSGAKKAGGPAKKAAAPPSA